MKRFMIVSAVAVALVALSSGWKKPTAVRWPPTSAAPQFEVGLPVEPVPLPPPPFWESPKPIVDYKPDPSPWYELWDKARSREAWVLLGLIDQNDKFLSAETFKFAQEEKHLLPVPGDVITVTKPQGLDFVILDFAGPDMDKTSVSPTIRTLSDRDDPKVLLPPDGVVRVLRVEISATIEPGDIRTLWALVAQVYHRID